MKRIIICIIFLLQIVVPVYASRSAKDLVRLTIYPAKAGGLEKKYQLMVKVEDQIDSDAVPLYEKAVKSIPKDFDQEQITEWLKLPVEQLPQQQAEEALQKYLEPLKLVARAARCKECNWPEWKPGYQPVDLSGYRKLAYILRLWARLEISRRGYEGATIAMRTAFGMARHLGQAPMIIQALVGAAVGEVICREVEQFVQAKDSPNLYRALADLPRPFVDVEKAIENEKKVSLDSAPNKLIREQIVKQKAEMFDRVRSISKRLDNNLNGLQCVEAIRHYAATHEGQLAETLSNISQMEVPKDVMSGKAFEYRRTSAGAVLKSVMPEGGRPKDMVHYEIVLKE
ncbi:MAG: hypothetical protein ACYSUX_08460 [Planctomycetota bacterium]|jgi:hypothetical protein